MLSWSLKMRKSVELVKVYNPKSLVISDEFTLVFLS